MTIWLAMGQAFVCMTMVFAVIGIICGTIFAVFVYPKAAIPIGMVILFVILTMAIYTSGGVV